MHRVSTETSRRISLLRFPLIVGVVYIHAYATEERFSNGVMQVASVSTIVNFVQNLCSQVLARVAVPLFYAISGFLFFATFDGSRRSYEAKLRSRVNTLLIPYLIWNALTIACFALAQSQPITSTYLSGQNKLISEYGPLDYLNAFVGYGPKRQPIAYQLWYIRDLMLLVLLAPVINALAQNWAKTLLTCSAAVWLFINHNRLLPIDPEAWLFFCFGSVIARNTSWVARIDKAGPWATLIYLGLAMLDVALPRTHLSGMIAHKVGICFGVVAAWYLVGKIPTASHSAKVLIGIAPFSFFVFAAHPLILITVRKLAYKQIVPESGLAILSIYLLAPVIAIAITVGAGAALRSFVPRAFKILSGGRAQS